MAKSIKVTVSMTLTIDPEAWDLAYGSGTTAAEIRNDVRSYMLNATHGLAPVDEGGIVDVVVKGS